MSGHQDLQNNIDQLQAMIESHGAGALALLDEMRHDLRRARREMAQLDIDHGCEIPGLPPEGVDGESDREEIVRLTLAEGERLWRLGIIEPTARAQNGAPQIDRMIRTKAGLKWTWEKEYIKDEQFAWCGAFGGTALAAAQLRQDIRYSIMASCYRLWKNWGQTDRLIPMDSALPGDILVVGAVTKGAKTYGSHITLIKKIREENGRRIADTYEGNAHGTSSDGSQQEGVIQRSRPLYSDGLSARTYRGLKIYRPRLGDFEG